MTRTNTWSLKSFWWWWVVVGWVGVSGIIASALVLLRQELRPVLENSLGEWQGPGPELDNNNMVFIFTVKNMIVLFHLWNIFSQNLGIVFLSSSIVCLDEALPMLLHNSHLYHLGTVAPICLPETLRAYNGEKVSKELFYIYISIKSYNLYF